MILLLRPYEFPFRIQNMQNEFIFGNSITAQGETLLSFHGILHMNRYIAALRLF